MSDPSSEDLKRLPRNAAPIPCPITMHDNISPPFDTFMGSIPTASPSAYSAFDVVLDDGTLQKRTISLSTLPDDLDEEEEEEEEEGEGEEVDEEESVVQHQQQESNQYNQLRKERYGCNNQMGSCM